VRWLWIDQIIGFEPGRRLIAVKLVSLAEEHLHDHFAADADAKLAPLPLHPMSLIIEGMAQTAGILVGSVNHFREKVILAKIGKAEMHCEITPGCALRFDATLERIDKSGASTVGSIARRKANENDWHDVGAVELMFSHIDQNFSGLAFPRENFVFSDNFRTILQGTALADLEGKP
jgi:3-hydroxyacyl-[acyl-carrier-protein] dehydratase